MDPGDESVTVVYAESTAAVMRPDVTGAPPLSRVAGSGETGIVVTHGAALVVAADGPAGLLRRQPRTCSAALTTAGKRSAVHIQRSGSRVQLASCYNETAVDQKPGVDFASMERAG